MVGWKIVFNKHFIQKYFTYVNIKGKGGIDGDGDVTKPENLKEFQKFVVDQTNHRGVHFMMADGVSRS